MVHLGRRNLIPERSGHRYPARELNFWVALVVRAGGTQTGWQLFEPDTTSVSNWLIAAITRHFSPKLLGLGATSCVLLSDECEVDANETHFQGVRVAVRC